MKWSKLFYNTSASATRVQHERDMSPRRVLHEYCECHTNDSVATRVKIFDFDNGTSENIFSHLSINYMAIGRFQGEEQFHSKNFLSEMPHSHAKMRLQSAPQ